MSNDQINVCRSASINEQSAVRARRSPAEVELRGGLALWKTVAPSKHLVWRGYRGPLKAPPPEITSQIQYMIATYQYHSKHRWWCTDRTWL